MRPSMPTSFNSFTILWNVCRLAKDFHFSKFDSIARRNLQGERRYFQPKRTTSHHDGDSILHLDAVLSSSPSHTPTVLGRANGFKSFSFSPTLFIAVMMHWSSL